MKFILIFIHCIVIGLLCGTLLNAWVPPSVMPYLGALSIAFPALMLIHLALIGIEILAKPKAALFFMVASLLFINPVRRWINYTKPQPPGKIKVVSVNGHQDEKGAMLYSYLDRQDADVVFLQEATFKTGDSAQMRNESVVAIRTKHKILAHQNLEIGNGNSQAFATDIEIGGQVVRFINVYLEPFYLNKDLVKGSAEDETSARTLLNRLTKAFKFHEEQVKIIRAAVKASPYPVIMGGDFNSVPNSFEYYTIADGLKDSFLEAGRGSATSFHDYKFPIRIDYFFTTQDIHARTYRVDRSEKISDHFPVIATFDLTAPR